VSSAPESSDAAETLAEALHDVAAGLHARNPDRPTAGEVNVVHGLFAIARAVDGLAWSVRALATAVRSNGESGHLQTGAITPEMCIPNPARIVPVR
jgi:hypothetical protein